MCRAAGAGNQTPVVALDILHKLIACDEVVVVKLNPVNEYLGPVFRKMFTPFVKRGFLEFVYGGKEVGAYLTQHDKISSIHLTGSADTFNAIMWGSPQAEVRIRPCWGALVVLQAVCMRW